MLLSSRPLLDTRADRALYVDRPDESADLERAVAAGLNTLVIGSWGSGKTSFLRHHAYPLREERQHLVEMIDAGSTTDAESLLTLLVERLLGPRGHPVGPEPNGRPAGRSDAGRLLALLDRLRRELPELVDRPPQDPDGRPAWDPACPVVILLDNAPPAAAHALFGRLRDEVWSLPVVWVLSAESSGVAGFLEPPADAFFEVRVVIGPLDDDAAVRLMRARLAGDPLDDGVTDGLLKRIADGLPERTPRQLVTALREVVVGGAGAVPEASTVDGVTDQQRARALRLSHLGRSASMLVAELQSRGGAASASDDGLLDALGWTRSRAAQVFRQLEAAELVTSSERRSNGAGRPRKVYELVGTVL
jgi:hypothetical protein